MKPAAAPLLRGTGGTLPPRTPRAWALPWDADALTPPRKPLSPPPVPLLGRCLLPMSQLATAGSAPTCARGGPAGGSRLGAAPWDPLQHCCSLQPRSCTWQPPHPSGAPGAAASRAPEGGKAGGGEKIILKKPKKAKEKKNPLGFFFFFFFPFWKHFQLYKCPDVGRTAPAPRSPLPIPRDAHPGMGWWRRSRGGDTQPGASRGKKGGKKKN